MTRQLICEGRCNGDAVQHQRDVAQRLGDVIACIKMGHRLVHTPHEPVHPIHGRPIWVCEKCGTKRIY